MTKLKKKTFDRPGNLQSDVLGIEIDNPNYQRQHAGAPGNPKTISVSYNRNESPASLWYHGRSKSIDEHQYAAAIKFRLIYELSCGTGARAFDYTVEFVDGGKLADPYSDARLDAQKQLLVIAKMLGPLGYDLTVKTCGQCIFLSSQYKHDVDRRKYANVVKEMLELLAVHFGLKNRPTRSFRAA